MRKFGWKAKKQDDDPDNEYLNTETGNIEFKKSHSYDIAKQCLKQLLNATYVGNKLIPSTRFKKQEQKSKKKNRIQAITAISKAQDC